MSVHSLLLSGYAFFRELLTHLRLQKCKNKEKLPCLTMLQTLILKKESFT